MNKQQVATINVMLSVIILVGLLIIPVHAAGSTTVKVDSLSQSISSGSTFTISIACIPGQTLKAFELQVVFNPSLLQANSVSEGNIFNSYSTFFNAGSIDNSNGTINNIYDVILGPYITSSSGTLVTISFTAKSTSGTSSINLTNVGITNNVDYMPITIINGSVQITTEYENEPPSVIEQNNPPNPPTQPTGKTFVRRGVTYNYTSSAFDPDNDAIRLRFDWGDGTYSSWTAYAPANTTISLSHSWRNVSSYNISVIAQDENGVNSSWSDTLSVTISPAASKKEKSIIDIITTSNKISVNETVQFNASTSYIPDDAIVSYYWLFGDGEIQAGQTATHTYTTPGQYSVSLTMINTLGEIFNKKINITVTPGNQVMALSAMNFISSNLTSIIIGTMVALICILLVFSWKKNNLQFFTKYIVLGQKWITQRIRKITGVTHSIFITLKPILKITNVKENKTINTSLQYAPTEHNVKKIDDIELAYIHRKIDQIIMND
jgi:PKD repeat protein